METCHNVLSAFQLNKGDFLQGSGSGRTFLSAPNLKISVQDRIFWGMGRLFLVIFVVLGGVTVFLVRRVTGVK